jgi:cytochrome c2
MTAESSVKAGPGRAITRLRPGAWPGAWPGPRPRVRRPQEQAGRPLPQLAVMLVLAGAGLAGCDGPPDRTPTLGEADPQRGLRLVVEHGCTACHAFPGVQWPRGRLGPSLEGFGRQGLIAGQLPNQPGVLMRFVRDAPSLVPGTAMPAFPMSDQDARDVTAYLLRLEPR